MIRDIIVLSNQRRKTTWLRMGVTRALPIPSGPPCKDKMKCLPSGLLQHREAVQHRAPGQWCAWQPQEYFGCQDLAASFPGFQPLLRKWSSKAEQDAKHSIIICWKEWSVKANAVHEPSVQQYPVQFIKNYSMIPVFHLFPENELKSPSSYLLPCFKNKSCHFKESLYKAGRAIKLGRLISPWLALSQ